MRSSCNMKRRALGVHANDIDSGLPHPHGDADQSVLLTVGLLADIPGLGPLSTASSGPGGLA
jgi:hypothetical protein